MLQCNLLTSAGPVAIDQEWGAKVQPDLGQRKKESAVKLWLANIDPEVTDDELRELVRKYTKLEVARLTRETGDGSRRGAALEFDKGSREALYEAQRRLNGLYWKNRALTAHVPM
jgi:RNA recognition motif-containing protein